ncbi:hypothetical protein [Succinimonas sp.]|jgi:hypothetical protein|uniref:hypothetical protein n=1 Tax=Succinimonas sp. TaxID=1936151 RepID=UPI003866300D
MAGENNMAATVSDVGRFWSLRIGNADWKWQEKAADFAAHECDTEPETNQFGIA